MFFENVDSSPLRGCLQRGNFASKITAMNINQRFATRVKENDYLLSEIPEKGLSICRIEDIDALMRRFSVERLHLVGTDMFSGMIRDLLANMSEETFKMYVEYIYTICERPDMIGLSGHLLDIFHLSLHYIIQQVHYDPIQNQTFQ